MSIFRSQEMALVQIFMPTEAVYFCVAEMGEQNLVEFREVSNLMKLSVKLLYNIESSVTFR